MSKEIECHERLTKVFRENFDNPTLEIEDEHNADSIPGWDSLAHVTLIVSIEEEFGVSFSTAEIASLNCVGDIRKIIIERAEF
ncbi:MAG: acyl carrier protein [bacterium]|nr:acyl carrier protein [bacterium]MBU1918288.1 acyl carrier protein [bacterium]